MYHSLRFCIVIVFAIFEITSGYVRLAISKVSLQRDLRTNYFNNVKPYSTSFTLSKYRYFSATRDVQNFYSQSKPSSWGKIISSNSRLLSKIIVPIASMILGVRTAFASSASKLHGWDLYGRVPYDDWIFTNDNLLNPNLFKRSMIEAVRASTTLLIAA